VPVLDAAAVGRGRVLQPTRPARLEVGRDRDSGTRTGAGRGSLAAALRGSLAASGRGRVAASRGVTAATGTVLSAAPLGIVLSAAPLPVSARADTALFSGTALAARRATLS
jgi:hypothetical protein